MVESVKRLNRKGQHFRSYDVSTLFIFQELIKLDENKRSIKRNLCKLLQMFKKDSKDGIICEGCIYAINYLGHLFPKNTTKEEILNGLKEVCTRFPPLVMIPCDAIIELYGDFLVKLLLGKIDPEAFCEKLGVCQAILQEKN